jgi:hypothetical protein
MDRIVLSLLARGLTTGEIAAHFEEAYGARVSRTRSAGSIQFIEQGASGIRRSCSTGSPRGLLFVPFLEYDVAGTSGRVPGWTSPCTSGVVSRR